MTRKYNSEQTVSKILDVAAELFMEKGYAKTTMQDIVNGLGMSKGAIFYHFKSKEDVMTAVIERMVGELTKRATEIAEDSAPNAHEKMRRIIEAINLAGSPNEAMVWELHKRSNALMHQMSIAEIIHKLSPILAKVVEQGISEGIYNTSRPLETIEFLLASNQFYLDVSVFHWTMDELVVRATNFVRIMELSLGAAEGSFAFLLDNLNTGLKGSAGSQTDPETLHEQGSAGSQTGPETSSEIPLRQTSCEPADTAREQASREQLSREQASREQLSHEQGSANPKRANIE
jgi:AcrR family transcriptional regulator